MNEEPSPLVLVGIILGMIYFIIIMDGYLRSMDEPKDSVARRTLQIHTLGWVMAFIWMILFLIVY